MRAVWSFVVLAMTARLLFLYTQRLHSSLTVSLRQSQHLSSLHGTQEGTDICNCPFHVLLPARIDQGHRVHVGRLRRRRRPIMRSLAPRGGRRGPSSRRRSTKQGPRDVPRS